MDLMKIKKEYPEKFKKLLKEFKNAQILKLKR